jgi:putative DNA primase/helicase
VLSFIASSAWRTARPARTEGAGRKYRQERWTPGGYRGDVEGIRRVPYRLPELVASIAQEELIFIPEARNAWTSSRLGRLPPAMLAADEITPHFEGADVVILPDNDSAGREHEIVVASKLQDAQILQRFP